MFSGNTLAPLQEMINQFTCRPDDFSGGKHRVFGSDTLNILPQTSTIASHMPRAVGMSFALEKTRQLQMEGRFPNDAIVYCGFGDASFNHACAQSSFNYARYLAYTHHPAPILFVCYDNHFGISTPTPEQWIADNMRNQLGIEWFAADGMNMEAAFMAAQQAQAFVREHRRPAFLHLNVERYLGHAGEDYELSYRAMADIEQAEDRDVLIQSVRCLNKKYGITSDQFLQLYEEINQQIEQATIHALQKKALVCTDSIQRAILPPARHWPTVDMSTEHAVWQATQPQRDLQLSLARAINLGLYETLCRYPQAVVFGEDVSGEKGGVYSVTRGLATAFSVKRVFNTLLDETSILATAISLGQQGLLPIAEIQYQAYLHNAIDQIRGEAATAAFFSQGKYPAPMLVRLAGLGGHQFGGHFHNENSFAALREIPGIVIAVPADPAEAVKLLRTCIQLVAEQQRVVIFIEPIALYHRKDLHQKGDQKWLQPYPHDMKQIIPLGEVSVEGQDDRYCIVTYGNGLYHARKAAAILQQQHQLSIQIIQMQWLHPLPIDSLIAHLTSAQKILLFDESRQTGSPSEQIIAMLLDRGFDLQRVHRLCAKDSFIPLGPAATLLFPNSDDIVAFFTSR
ncbi:MAG: MFS transporter [Legionellales bacterium]|nr:MFS transporter [Legionellales bacterium]